MAEREPASPLVLLGYARTPFGRFGGAMRRASLPSLGATAVRAAVRRAGRSPQEVDELVIGVNLPGSDRSIARQVALHAGCRADSVAYTVDRACCSSLAALTMATRSVAAGDAKIAVAGGSENMSRVPYFLEDLRWGNRLGEVRLVDQLVISCPYTGVPRAKQASDEAGQYGVDRSMQDAWAERSQQRWESAAARGVFDEEIVPFQNDDGTQIVRDEAPRAGVTVDALASLPMVNGSATVTAGNAPGLGTGAAATVVTSAAYAEVLGQQPLATVLATAAVSGPPANIASAPAVAARSVLEKAGLRLSDVDLIEVNEAFAAVPVVTLRVLADGRRDVLDHLTRNTNVNGGAIAVGHPTGATAARLVMTIVGELRRRGGGLGLVTLCGGIGEAHAAVVRV